MSTTVSDEELKKITDLPTMADLLPYVFKNGSRIDSMTVSCSQCGGTVPLKNAHGQFVEYGTTAALSMQLLCYDCQIISPFEARLRDDGTMLVRSDAGWVEERYAAEPGVFELIKEAVKKVI